MFNDLLNGLNPIYFLLSVAIFFLGIYLGPEVVNRDIRWLLVYPRWMKRLMEKYFKRSRGFIIVFLTIFLLNNFSLFTSYVSGFLVILPPLAVFFTGLNVSIISYDLMGWKGIWQILVNPVAWLEFPAAWISFTLAFQLAEAQWTYQNFNYTIKIFELYLPLYLKYVVGLLFLAALLETALIMLVEKMKIDDETQDKESDK